MHQEFELNPPIPEHMIKASNMQIGNNSQVSNASEAPHVEEQMQQNGVHGAEDDI